MEEAGNKWIKGEISRETKRDRWKDRGMGGCWIDREMWRRRIKEGGKKW